MTFTVHQVLVTPSIKERLIDILKKVLPFESDSFHIQNKYYSCKFQLAVEGSDNVEGKIAFVKSIEDLEDAFATELPLKVAITDSDELCVDERFVEFCMEKEIGFLNMKDDEFEECLLDVFQNHTWSESDLLNATGGLLDEAESILDALTGEDDIDLSVVMQSLTKLRQKSLNSSNPEDRFAVAEKVALAFARHLDGE
jgi:hypothetical protein